MEYITYKRKTGDLVEYLVKFQGYDKLEWIPEEDIDGKLQSLKGKTLSLLKRKLLRGLPKTQCIRGCARGTWLVT